jgi:ABC-2 type transport system permease protein
LEFMTFILVRKLLRDSRPALIVVCLVLFLFAGLWVKITQRVTAEITPFFNTVARVANLPPKLFEDVLFKGPGKISQAVLGGSDLHFEKPMDFLSVGLLHPVVLILSCVWAVGRACGAVAGEIDRGTMELLMSQPVPRNRLILAHLAVDAVVIPILCLSFYGGTQFGLWVIGPFEIDYAGVRQALGREVPPPLLANLGIPTEPEMLEVSARPQLPALANLAALVFAISGITMMLSACGRSRWRAIGFGVLIALVMFIANVLGQLWDGAAFVRPFSVFYYYQPQKIMLRGEWTADLGKVWGDGLPVGPVPAVGVLFAVGGVGYAIALYVFARRDLPAPL